MIEAMPASTYVRGFLVCSSLLLALAVGARVEAQGLAPPSQLSGLSLKPGKVAVGTWVRYSLYDVPRGRVVVVRLAALSRKASAQWYEVKFTLERGRAFVLQTLVEGSLDKPTRVRETIIQPPGQIPLRLPEAWAKKPLPALAQKKPGKEVGKTSISVPAGTFAVTHYRRTIKGQVEDSWISTKVPFAPVVRYRSAKVRLELLGYGKDATSSLTGEPVKLDPRLLRRLGGKAP